MPKKFPLFIDLTEKKVVVYGAGNAKLTRRERFLQMPLWCWRLPMMRG